MNDSELLQATHRAYDMVFKSAVDFACVKAAYDLDLFNILAHGPKNLDELTATTSSLSYRLHRLLISLQQVGLLDVNDNTWSLTPLAKHFFVATDDNPNLTMVPHVEYMVDVMERFFLRLKDVVQGNLDFTSLVPYPPQTPEDSLYYENIHRSNLHFPIKMMKEHLNLAETRHMVDVGGGIGDIAAALCNHFPNLTVTLINLPSAIKLVQENVASKGLSGRITPIALDMYKEPYPACDALLFGRILYPMNEQFCTMLCKKAYDALESGGRIIIMDMIINEPEVPTNYDYLVHYVCSVGLGEFSVLEFKHHTLYPEILKGIGFENVTCHEEYDHVLYQAIKP